MVTTTMALILALVLPGVGWAQQRVPVVDVEGPIGPVAAEYVVDSLERAAVEDYEMVVVRVDTPGGLDTSMRKIVRALSNSPLPVVVWVGPTGARAASAGLFIVAAGDLSAMAPGTNIGAAHPVSLGGGEGDEAKAQKAEEDAVAYIRALAQRKGRDPGWFEAAVRESRSLSAEDARDKGVVDFVAVDLRGVLQKLEGRVVEKGREEIVLSPAEAVTASLEMTPRQKVLRVLSNPNVAYLLLLLGFYGLFFELANPGAIFPGVIGGLCLILAFVGLQTLPFSYAGVLLMLLGLLLLLLEVKITSYGLLTVGGTLSLLLGSLMMFKSAEPYQRLSYAVVLPAVAATVAFFAFAVGKGLAAQRRRPSSGLDALVGKVGQVTEAVGPGRPGRVFVHGESWKATGAVDLEAGQRAKILAIREGMSLAVGPVEEEGAGPPR